MFYEESLINKLLICHVCECQLEDPRVLPCGKSICNKCVDFLTPNESKKHIKCQNCQETHDIPSNGFPKNRELAELVGIKPDEVSRGKIATEFKRICKLMSEKTKNLQLNLEIGETQIRERCDDVRNRVQQAIEEAHMKLDEFHGELMQEIDLHEKKCVSSFKLLRREKADELLSESYDFQVKSSEILKQFVIDDLKLDASMKEATLLLTTLESAAEAFEREVYQDGVISFAKNYAFSKEVVGQIKFKNRDLVFLENRLKPSSHSKNNESAENMSTK